ncbi:MAG TPA: DNA alkylation repair protein, partial [Sphingobacteriaceae bacterium]
MRTLDETMELLRRLGDEASVAGMARFGITVNQALGIRVPVLRQLAKEIRRNHALALELWGTGVHEARLLAVLIADPRELTGDLMDRWVSDFNSWDICDQACLNLFIKSPLAYEKAKEWTARTGEFEKRAGFAMMAALAVHDKKAPDDRFISFLSLISEHATDDRNFVKKAVNWALRQIGKRNRLLRELAIQS